MSIRCPDCGKEFSKRFNLNRHWNSHHEQQSSQKLHTCELCNKNFLRKETLQQHLHTAHSSPVLTVHKCQLCEFKTIYKYSFKYHLHRVHSNDNNNGKIVKPKLFSCKLCDAKYSLRTSLYRHSHKVHGGEKELKIKRKCPLCNFSVCGTGSSASNDVIYDHFKNIHGKSMKHHKHTFNSEEEFYAWKSEIEKDTAMKFIKISMKTPRSLYYKCHRSGYYVPQGKNIRRLKYMGSCKTNAFCPAFIKSNFSAKSNKINVVYQSTHIGHSSELHHFSLTSAKINQDAEDPVSIDAWVEAMKSSSTTAYIDYKPLGQFDRNFPKLTEQDFLLVFMTDVQKEIHKKNDCDVIFVDVTNHYNFQLFTLLTIDESHEGFPVAFMFTNRSDEIVLSLFFQKIKDYLGSISPRVFMSDVEETCWLAWTKAMGGCPYRLYCSWHVLKAWKENVTSKIKCKEKQQDVFKTLESLMHDFESATFHRTLEEALEKWNGDTDTKCFGNYFSENYASPGEFRKWAYCYRINTGINFYLSMENFNRVLKCCHLKGKKMKRSDETLLAILNLMKDKLSGLIVKIYKRKVFMKLQNLRTRHKLSLQMKQDSVLINGNVWQVLSSDLERTNIVVKVKDCKNCLLVCSECNSCFHEYACSCSDSAVKNNMCKHIHLVASTGKNDVKTQQPVGEFESVFIVDILNDYDQVAVETVLTQENVPSY